MVNYGITSGTDLVVYDQDVTHNSTRCLTYPMAFHRNKPEEYDSEFEFSEKKRKPHHIRKKKGWER